MKASVSVHFTKLYKGKGIREEFKLAKLFEDKYLVKK